MTIVTKAAGASSQAGSLAGVRILDLSSVIMGPWATQILADLGADVICIETAGGDPVRFLGQGHHPHLSGVALNILRNKRNVTLNLKHPHGLEAFLKIAGTCDMMITNLRPAARKRLKVTYDDLRAVRPDLIYCHAQGWPTDSDRADHPAYDDVIQAAGGMAAISSMQTGSPSLSPVPVADQVGSLTIVYSVLAALYHRERTGEGQSIEIPMTDAMASFVMVMHGKDAILQPPLGKPGYERLITKLRAPLPTMDGFLIIVLYTRADWVAFLKVGGVEGAEHDPRLLTPVARNQHYESLYQEMAGILKTRSTADWMTWCASQGVACSPLVSIETLIENYPTVAHSAGGQYKHIPSPAQFSATPTGLRRQAPLPGEHNDEVLEEVGYSEEEIAWLKVTGALWNGDLKPR